MVPQLVQGLVNKFLTQPSYMQGVTDVLSLLKTKHKLPRHTNFKSAYSEPYHAVRTRESGRTSYVSSGHFSVCFQHRDADGNTYAIKVSMRQDDGALPYYQWLWENKKWLDSEHYPELFFFGKVHGYDVCVMEWLEGDCELVHVDYMAAMGERYLVEAYRHEHTDCTLDLLEIGEELEKLSRKLRLSFDIHSENMRMRDDGTIVFSDPFSFIQREH